MALNGFVDLCMNESPLEVVSEFRDLGLLFDSNLSWNIHVHSIVYKVNEMLGPGGGGGGGNSIVFHVSFLTHSACQYDVT